MSRLYDARISFPTEWLSGDERISLTEMTDRPAKLVTIDHDDAHPRPRRIAHPVRTDTHKRKRPPPQDPTDCQPESATPSQLGLPEQAMPSPWTPTEDTAPIAARPVRPL